MDTDPQLDDLEQQRARLYAELAATGDLRRGSVTVNYRRCGKPNCACAGPEHPGHGPRYLWTRSVAGGKTKGRQLKAGEVDKVRDEIDTYQQFVALSHQIVAVNETICEARPPGAPATDRPARAEAEKGGSSTGSSRTSPPS